MAHLPPGPTWPVPIQIAKFLYRPTATLKQCADRYGDAFTLRVGTATGEPLVVFSKPEHIEAIVKAPPAEIDSHEANEIFRPFFGDGSILLMTGKRHRRERKLLMPPFHGERMRAYGDTIREITDAEIDRFVPGQIVNMQRLGQRITLDVILRVVFGAGTGPRLSELREAIKEGADIGSKPYLMVPFLQFDWGKWSPWGRFLVAKHRAERVTHELIREARRADPEERVDVLTMLAHATDEEGERLTVDELGDELATLNLAGHETTASALAFALGWILPRPEIRQRIVDDLGSDDTSFLDATIDETMRLSPVAPAFGRMMLRDGEIAGFSIPAGTRLAPCPYLTHRRPDLYPSPDRFDPERFLGKSPTPYEFFPFGGGRRRCIGAALATYEMRIVLSQLLSRVSLELTDDATLEPMRRGVTVSPRGGMPMRVTDLH